MATIQDMVMRAVENYVTGRTHERHALVTSYDPKNYLAKVTYQPNGEESGWLPIETGHIGQTYGEAAGLQPGSGQGGAQGSGTGAAGGTGSSSGGGQGADGDQVVVRFMDGNHWDIGKIVQRVHSSQDTPPQVQSGEMVKWTKFKQDKNPGPDAQQSGTGNSEGQKIFWKNDGSLNAEDGNGAHWQLDGNGNYTHNATGKHTIQVINQRDGNPYASLSGQQSSGSPQQIHHTTLDKNNGVTTGAFQDQHQTTWSQTGITHTSTKNVTSKAPNIPHLGNTSISGGLGVSGAVTGLSFTSTSDVRLKSNVSGFPSVLHRVMKMKVKSFDKKKVDIDADGKQFALDETDHTFGFIAQELREVFPDLVHGDEKDGYLTVAESKVGIVLLAAFQEFVTEMRSEMSAMKKAIANG